MTDSRVANNMRKKQRSYSNNTVHPDWTGAGAASGQHARSTGFRLALLVLFAATLVAACDGDKAFTGTAPLCSEAWYRMVEAQVPTGDGRGHGPDPGSDEWKSVVEFRLGIRGAPGVPDRDSEAWCRHIDEILRSEDMPVDPGRAG